MNDREWACMYWLTCQYNIRSCTRRKLLEYAGDAQAIYNMKEQHLMELTWLTDGEREKVQQAQKEEPQRQLEVFRKKGGQFIWQGHPGYPKRLSAIHDAPFGLFYYGMLPEETKATVGVVGARACSSYGRAAAERYGAAFAQAKVTVISGMASGIDSAAQMAALRSGGTSCGVLGCGIDICYPSSSQELYWLLRTQGCVLSEYPIGIRPFSSHFPARNRIISGLSDRLLVVEAREKSGSLITADMALEQGKDVFAVPGRNADALSKGCNELIHQGAGIAIDPENLLLDMGFGSLENINNCKKITNSLANDEKLLYSWVDLSPKSLDEILGESSFSEERTIELLVDLQLKGYICETGRNYYVRARLG